MSVHISDVILDNVCNLLVADPNKSQRGVVTQVMYLFPWLKVPCWLKTFNRNPPSRSAIVGTRTEKKTSMNWLNTNVTLSNESKFYHNKLNTKLSTIYLIYKHTMAGSGQVKGDIFFNPFQRNIIRPYNN